MYISAMLGICILYVDSTYIVGKWSVEHQKFHPLMDAVDHINYLKFAIFEFKPDGIAGFIGKQNDKEVKLNGFNYVVIPSKDNVCKVIFKAHNKIVFEGVFKKRNNGIDLILNLSGKPIDKFEDKLDTLRLKLKKAKDQD